MRSLMKDIFISLWLGFLVPGILLNSAVFWEREQHTEIIETIPAEPDQIQSVTVAVSAGEPLKMEMDSYLTGVLLAEMPARFHEEALKAQAVAARTYTWKACLSGGKHTDGSVCTDPSCCQSYISAEDYYNRGGTQENLDKVKRCVESTCSMILLYRGEPIEATYFSSSGGSTESSLAVWGTDYPYLRSVSSPEPEAASLDCVSFSAASFQRLLGRDLPADPADWFGEVEYTRGGGVANLEIAGQFYTGVELRSLLDLRSTDFSVEVLENGILITTKGHGHRVGMSQHGANVMANSGSSYQKILQHYYPGTTLAPLWEEKD